jgi:signal transduction histidine kinase
MVLIRKDGSEALCTVNLNTLFISPGCQLFQNIARDVTEETRLYDDLRYYATEISRAQEKERMRISRELHDGISQTLIAILRRMDNFINNNPKLSQSEAEALKTFDEQIRQALTEVRHFGRDLRPSVLDDLGLMPAMEWLCDQLRDEFGIQAKLQVVGSERKLPPEAELLLFRIIQEATRNIGKHSRATQADIKYEFVPDKVLVSITDNGIGFKPPKTLGALPRYGRLGLAGMSERVRLLGGSIKLRSAPGKGTSLYIEIPLKPAI